MNHTNRKEREKKELTPEEIAENLAFIQRVIQGERKATVEFLKMVKPFIWSAIRRVSSRLSQEAAEDVLQEIMVELYKNECHILQGYRGQCSIKSFVYTVAYCKTLYLVRRKQYQQCISFDDENVTEPADHRPVSCKMTYGNILEQVSGMLDDAEYDKFLRLFVDCESPSTVAEHFKVTANKVSIDKYRIAQKLQKNKELQTLLKIMNSGE